ncbi:MAG: hypothetical protein KF799_11485 [Bdellovibrionales bacterium]|nr:hypothetical protein [Bdellovibrionales bacterium]
MKQLIHLASMLILALAWPNALAHTGERQHSFGSCEADLASRSERQDLRQWFIREYSQKIFADEQQNQKWINHALHSRKPGLQVTIENAWTKRLNHEILNNRDFVTALTNYHKELLLEELNRHRINLALLPYHDFKGIRLTLILTPTIADYTRLEEAFATAQARFYSSPILQTILREEDLQQNWFFMGLGTSESQANIAARFAAKHGQGKAFAYFWDKKVQENLKASLERVKTLHAELVQELRGTDLLENLADGTGLQLDIFAAARKAESNEALLKDLKMIFPNAPAHKNTVARIAEYVRLVDGFSPSLLIPRRELLTVYEAPFGAMSIDFVGLGAENLKATAHALILAQDVDEAIALTRKFEREVTLHFNERKAMVEGAVQAYFSGQAQVRFSGDDGIIIPLRPINLRDQLFLLRKLASLMPRPYFRMAVIKSESASSGDSSQLLTHAESIEKRLRPLIIQRLGIQRSNDLNLQIYIPQAGPVRKVFLILSDRKRLSPDEKRIMKEIFPIAVQMIQREVQEQGHEVSYESVEIYAIFGRDRLK